MNFYDVMDLPKDASQDAIEIKYRILSKKLHPDKASVILRKIIGEFFSEEFTEEDFGIEVEKKKEEMEASFILLKEAYDNLSDPIKRKYYDKHGKVENKPNHKEMVRTSFINLLKQVISVTNSPETEDIVAHMLEAISLEKKKLKSQKVQMLKTAKKITVVKKRLSGPSTGIHTGIFKSDLQAIRNGVKQVKDNLRLFEDIKEMVEEYSYKVDKVEDFGINALHNGGFGYGNPNISRTFSVNNFRV